MMAVVKRAADVVCVAVRWVVEGDNWLMVPGLHEPDPRPMDGNQVLRVRMTISWKTDPKLSMEYLADKHSLESHSGPLRLGDENNEYLMLSTLSSD